MQRRRLLSAHALTSSYYLLAAPATRKAIQRGLLRKKECNPVNLSAAFAKSHPRGTFEALPATFKVHCMWIHEIVEMCDNYLLPAVHQLMRGLQCKAPQHHAQEPCQ